MGHTVSGERERRRERSHHFMPEIYHKIWKIGRCREEEQEKDTMRQGADPAAPETFSLSPTHTGV